MTDQVKKVRGKGVKPPMVYRAIRIPRDVLEYYETSFPNASKKMRDVLTAYKEFKQNSVWTRSIDHNDIKELEYNHGANTRKESEGQSSQDSEGV